MQNDLPEQVPAELTDREKEILCLIATGTSNKDIARQLFISSNTVKVHLRNIFAKIGVSSRTEAAMYAVHSGLIKNADSTTRPGGESDVYSPLVDQIFFSPSLETNTRRGWLVRQWVPLVLVILLLGIAAGLGIFFLQPSAPLPLLTAVPSPTAPSRWKRLASLPAGRSGLAVAVYENRIYAIGGETSQGVTGSIEIYDPVTNSWQNKSPMPFAVTDINAAVIGGKIYVPGGRQASGKVTNILEIYDPRKDLWEEGASLPVAMSAYALVAFEGKLYQFGGWDGNRYLDTVLVYDPTRDAWTTGSPMPTGRGFAGAAVVDGKIFVVGGFNGAKALAVNEVYYPDRDQITDIPWEKAANLPEGRYAMGFSSLTDMLYLVGGKGDPSTILSPLLYITQIDSWQTFEVPPIKIGESLGLVPIGNNLYVVGGKNIQETSNSTLSYQAIYVIVIPITK
jgi:DNA-binding CsgD family transcriptional regulator